MGMRRVPRNSTILGAAKLTGRVRNFSVGVLAAATDEENALATVGGRHVERGGRAAHVLFGLARAARVQRSVVARVHPHHDQSQLAETVSFLPDSAVTGGVDYNWRMGKRWGLNGYWAGSQVSGSVEAIDALQRNNVHSFQRPDADHVELDPFATSMRGHSGNIDFNKLAGERTRLNVNLGYRVAGLRGQRPRVPATRRRDPAEQLGADSLGQAGQVHPQHRVSISTSGRAFNFDGDRLNSGGNINLHWQFSNLWSSGGGINYNARSFDDRLTRGGPGGYTLPNVNGWHYLNTDDRKMVSFNWNFNFYEPRPIGTASRWNRAS